MKLLGDSNEQSGLVSLFDQTAEAPSGSELTRLAARAQDIPASVGKRSAWKWWLPLGVSAVAATLGFWLIESRREGRGAEVAIAARAVPPHITAENVEGPRVPMRNSPEPSTLAEEGSEEEESASEVNMDVADAEPSVLTVGEFFEDTDGLRAFNAEDLFGPALDSDVDAWMLATNDFSGEK